jgi:hypothetical protein
MTRRRRATLSARALCVSLMMAAGTRAQAIDVERPSTFVTGRPGGARVDRIDAARRGFSSTPLPASGLRTAWHASLGVAFEQAPVVDAQGTTYVVGTRGDVIALGPQGDERWRASTGSAQPGPLALLSDDTLVFVDATGEAVAVRRGAVRWRNRFGRGGPVHPGPLPLDDGGVVVATSHELAALDCDGNTVARAVVNEPLTAPLLAAAGRVVALGASGTVWGWVPGGVEPTRLATFGSPIDGGAALLDGSTLIAVTGSQARLATVDLLRRSSTVRAVASGGLWLGPPAVRGGVAYAELLVATGELAVAIGESGAELGRAAIGLRPSKSSGGVDADAGAPAGAASLPPHVAPLVDRNGTLAFATSDGSLGVVTGLGLGNGASTPTVELVVDACPPSLSVGRTSPPVTGLAPLAPGAFVAACASGTVLAVRDGRAGAAR